MHVGILWPVLKCGQSHLLCHHLGVLWLIGQGCVLTDYPLQDTQELPIHGVKDLLQGQHLLFPDILSTEVFTGREEIQVLYYGAITRSPVLQDTTTAETLHFIPGADIEKSSLHQVAGRHRGAAGPLMESPHPPGHAPHAGIKEVAASTPGLGQLCWCCFPHGRALQERMGEPRAVSCIPGSTHPALLFPVPVHIPESSCSQQSPACLGIAAQSRIGCFCALLLHFCWGLTGRAQRFPRLAANLQGRWNGEGRAKPALPPRLNQANLWHLICKINPQPFC